MMQLAQREIPSWVILGVILEVSKIESEMFKNIVVICITDKR